MVDGAGFMFGAVPQSKGVFFSMGEIGRGCRGVVGKATCSVFFCFLLELSC